MATIDDAIVERDGILTARIVASERYEINRSRAFAPRSILDNDAPVVAEFAADPVVISENGGTSTITVTLDQAPVEDEGFTVALSFAGTAERGTDFAAPARITVAEGAEDRQRDPDQP